ncbi:MAG: hypothetical protein ACD_62C00244G0005 [uncultured bacterium]|nr:MAG: hypothetical protein ACD_62C00244G0005 [uncultured bacterium]
METNKKRRVEVVLTILLVVIALVVFGLRVFSTNKADQEQALIAELKSVRTSVQLYLTMNKAFPADLKVLTTQKYQIGNKQRLYLTGVQVDANNNPIDSFGNAFSFNPSTGEVFSSTKGYESW